LRQGLACLQEIWANSTRTVFSGAFASLCRIVSGVLFPLPESHVCIGNLFNIICIVHHAFCHKKARCKFKIIARGAHGDGDRFSPGARRLAQSSLYLERLFGCQVILHVPRIDPGIFTTMFQRRSATSQARRLYGAMIRDR